jgi:hypothetical protein
MPSKSIWEIEIAQSNSNRPHQSLIGHADNMYNAGLKALELARAGLNEKDAADLYVCHGRYIGDCAFS